MCEFMTYRSIPEDISTPITFNIGFLGYTSELSIKGLRQFAENNKDEIRNVRNSNIDCELYLKDGTIIRAITYSERFLHGYKFDQLILFDDNRWNIGRERYQWEMIDKIRTYSMALSYVPDECQILYYEDLR